MISVIIATRNRAALLAGTLDALARQRPPDCPIEILVADNASTDNTADVVAAAAGAAPVRYLHEERRGKSHALNTAIEYARGELIVLTDDDVLPSPGWLAAYADVFARTGADFAVGRILPLWEAPPPRWLSPALYGVLAVPDGGSERLPIAAGVNEHIMPLGANMAIRRHVVERIGGWNTELGKLEGTLRTGEDHLFALEMLNAGFTGVYEPDASVRHRVPADRLRFGYFQRWYYDNGGIQAGLDARYPSTARYLWGLPRYLWRQFAGDVWTAVSGAARLNAARAAAGWMRTVWAMGYLRARWRKALETTPLRARTAAAPPHARP